MAHASSRQTIRECVRAMNSYYSNRIEGQSIHPLHIEAALHKNFSDEPDIARLQCLALAHINAESTLEDLVGQGESAMSSAFLTKPLQS